MKKNMNKVLSLLMVSSMTFTLIACGNTQTDTVTDTEAEESKDEKVYIDTTIYGQVTAINDSQVTMQLGELSESTASDTAPGDGNEPPEMPDSSDSSDTEASMDSSSDDSSQPPEKPASDDSSDSSSDSTSQPPAKPDSDDSSDGSSDSTSQPPEMPDSDNSSNDNSQAPDGESQPSGMPAAQEFTAGDETATFDLSDATITKDSETIDVSDLSEDDILEITFDSYGAITEVNVVTTSGATGGSGFGGSGTVSQGTSANTIDEDGDYSDESYESTGDDENALRVDGATVTLDSITVDKSSGSSSNTEDGDFYGMNAALLATNGATVTIKNATVNSSAQNGNGVFSYGSGTTVNISDSTITTTADNSGGIQTTGGGTTNASNLTVTTSGNSSAAIRSDRGGGTVTVDKGTYTSNGYNSPAVYSTADITVSNATLTANNSEALVIEGDNSITLTDCDVTGNMSDTKGTSSDENVHNVMIYQSMSGDAEDGTSTFSMTGGSLVSKNGDMFYVTNTHCILNLSGVDLVNEDSDAYLLNICGNSASHGWGTAGSNGAQVEFTADDQTLEGDIIVDTISTLNMTLSGNSTFTGTINIVDNADGGTAVSDNAVVTIEKGSTWTLTGDCTLTSLTNNGTINFNGYTITLADGTVLK